MQARTRVHEYGGGASLVHNGAVYYSHFVDNAMYSVSAPNATAAERLTPLDKNWRFADARISDTWCVPPPNPFPIDFDRFFLTNFMMACGRNALYAVREDHANEKDVINTVVAISLKDQSQHVLASGADFYSSPRVSSDGKHLCWIEWNHPNMVTFHCSLLLFFF